MMFAGERINASKNHAVLHVALRMPKGATLIVDGVDVVAQVHESFDRMADLPPRFAQTHEKATPASRSAISSTTPSAEPTTDR